MPHRRGSFHEDQSDLLERFAHRGTSAALDDQLREARRATQSGSPSPIVDIHQALFERAHG